MSGDENNPFWTGEDNVLQFKREEKSKGYIKITYDSLNEEVLQCDSFGPYKDLPGFIVFWRDDPEELICFKNGTTIRSIEFIYDFSPSESN